VDSKLKYKVKNFTSINERLCVIRIKGRFFNYSLINIHSPTNDSEEEAKDQFYKQLERAYAAGAGIRSWSGHTPCSDLWQWDVGVDQKGGEPIARIWEKGSSDDMRLKSLKMVSRGGGTSTNSIKSLTARMIRVLLEKGLQSSKHPEISYLRRTRGDKKLQKQFWKLDSKSKNHITVFHKLNTFF
jgi:hypothetical protein